MRRVVKVVFFLVVVYVAEVKQLSLSEWIVQVGVLKCLRRCLQGVYALGASFILEVSRLPVEVWRAWLSKRRNVLLAQLVDGLNLTDLIR